MDNSNQNKDHELLVLIAVVTMLVELGVIQPIVRHPHPPNQMACAMRVPAKAEACTKWVDADFLRRVRHSSWS
ncbi:hypothetical protein D3C76_1449600 [compost metagenome]